MKSDEQKNTSAYFNDIRVFSVKLTDEMEDRLKKKPKSKSLKQSNLTKSKHQDE